MKKVVTFVLLVSVCFLNFHNTAMAKTENKVKVVSKREYKMVKGIPKESTVVKGKKNGKTIWTFKTGKYEAAQLDRTYCYVKKNRVYIFEDNKITVLNQKNGKKVFSKKYKGVSGNAVKIDDKGNIYTSLYFEPTVTKISPKGKRVWQKDLSKKGLFWSGPIQIKGGKVIIKYYASDKDLDRGGVITLRAKDGKVLKVKYN